jgi:hypothetical protein
MRRRQVLFPKMFERSDDSQLFQIRDNEFNAMDLRLQIRPAGLSTLDPTNSVYTNQCTRACGWKSARRSPLSRSISIDL